MSEEVLASQCWAELWAKVPEVAGALLRRAGAAARHAVADVAGGVGSEAGWAAVSEAFGPPAAEAAAMAGRAVEVTARALDAFDLPLVRRGARWVAACDPCWDAPDELAALVDDRRYMDARLLHAAYEGLRAAGGRRRRAILRRCVLSRDYACVDFGLSLGAARPPEACPERPGPEEARALEGLVAQAGARGAWETYGWLLGYARSRGLLAVVRCCDHAEAEAEADPGEGTAETGWGAAPG